MVGSGSEFKADGADNDVELKAIIYNYRIILLSLLISLLSTLV